MYIDNKLGNRELPRLLKDTPAFYPHLNDFTRKLNFRYFSDFLNLESQNQVKNIFVGLPSSSIKICGKSMQEFLSYDRTNKQTPKQRLLFSIK